MQENGRDHIKRPKIFGYILLNKTKSFTYDHRTWTIGHPVRSAVLKPCTGRLVVGWVTTSEYLLLYVFNFLAFLFVEVGQKVEFCCYSTALLQWHAKS
jgi:hypothetical protein